MSARSARIEAKRQPTLGRVVLIRPLSFTLMALLATTAALALVVYLSASDYTLRAHASGVLAPDRPVLSVMAPSPGKVSRREVHEGQFVKAGDLLFVLTEEPSPAAATEDPQTKSRQDTVIRLNERLRAARSEAGKLDKQLIEQRAKLAESRAAVARLRKTIKGNLLSDPGLLRQLDVVLDHRSKLQALEKNRSSLARTMASVQKDLGQVRQALNEPPEAPEAAPLVQVTAPSDGTVTAILAEPGMPVAANALLTLTPASTRLEAQLYVPSRQAAAVQPGQKVHLRYRMAPNQAFSRYEGEVQEVSPSPTAAPELPATLAGMSAKSGAAALHRVRVSLTGQPQHLSAGTQVEAEILQGTRPLLEWAFEPRNSTKGTS